MSWGFLILFFTSALTSAIFWARSFVFSTSCFAVVVFLFSAGSSVAVGCILFGVAGYELAAHPAEDIVDETFGERNILVGGHAGRLETGVAEFIDQRNQRHAILQRHRRAGADDIHQAADGAALLGHSDKQLTRLAILIQPHRQIPFVSRDGKFVRNAVPRLGKPASERSCRCDACSVGLLFFVVFVLFGLHGLESLGAVAVNRHGL